MEKTQGGDTGVDQVKDKLSDAASVAQDKSHEAAEQARGFVRTQIDSRTDEAGKQVESVAGDIRSMSDELRKQGKEKPADLMAQAAERAEGIGNYLSSADGDQLLHDAEELARRQTWLFVAGGVALGFAASRLLKASSRERYHSARAGSGSRQQDRSTRMAIPNESGERSEQPVPVGAG